MGSINKAMLLGNLTKDPEVRFTGQGTAVCSFSVATDESYKGKDGAKVEKTEFHNVTAWGKLAELCGEYLQKGSQVFLEGKIQTETYEKDGQKKYSTKIVADNVVFLQRTKGSKKAETGTAGGNDVPAADDVPF